MSYTFMFSKKYINRKSPNEIYFTLRGNTYTIDKKCKQYISTTRFKNTMATDDKLLGDMQTMHRAPKKHLFKIF